MQVFVLINKIEQYEYDRCFYYLNNRLIEIEVQKMRIMVFDVPADRGGALTILNQYYLTAKNDISNNWIFVISTPKLSEMKNIKIINYPWVKRSWFHRLFFDMFFPRNLVRKYDPDRIISLQNIVIGKVKTPQTLYMHQPLPFVKKKYKIHENFKLWIYQNIIGRRIKASIRQAEKVIVQSQWILDECIKTTNCRRDKFVIDPPHINVKTDSFYVGSDDAKKHFIYPASAVTYKNHVIIVDALTLLSKCYDISNCEFVFTLTGNENKYIRGLKEKCEKYSLPVTFVGRLSIDDVYDYYKKSILVFPSFIETFGLPLLEARVHRCPIIAADTPFAREILQKYELVEYFDYDNDEQLAQILKGVLDGTIFIYEN